MDENHLNKPEILEQEQLDVELGEIDITEMQDPEVEYDEFISNLPNDEPLKRLYFHKQPAEYINTYDKQNKIKFIPQLNSVDCSINAVIRHQPMGLVLFSLPVGVFGCTYSSARANFAVSSGRIAYEIRILDSYIYQSDSTLSSQSPIASGTICSTCNNKWVDCNTCKSAKNINNLHESSIIIGFSSISSCYVPGIGNKNSFGFSTSGEFLFNTEAKVQKEDINTGDVITLVVHLKPRGSYEMSLCWDTTSLYKNGKKIGSTHNLPENLKNTALFPTIAVKNAAIAVNFGHLGHTRSLAYSVRYPLECLEEQLIASPLVPPDEGIYKVIFPIALPNQGGYKWVDEFLDSIEGRGYIELSDRVIWHMIKTSGYELLSLKTNQLNSTDRPRFSYGVGILDDRYIMRRSLRHLIQTLQRNFVVPEIRHNLLKNSRIENTKDFLSSWYELYAYVLIGPEELPEEISELEYEFEVNSDINEFWRHPLPRSGYLSLPIPDLSQKAFSNSFYQYSFPTEDEPFKEIKYLWLGEEQSRKYLQKFNNFHAPLNFREVSKTSASYEWYKSKALKWTEYKLDSKGIQRQYLHKLKDDIIKTLLQTEHLENINNLNDEDFEVYINNKINEYNYEIENYSEIEKPFFCYFTQKDWRLVTLAVEIFLILEAFKLEFNKNMHKSLLAMYFANYTDRKFNLDSYNIQSFAALFEILEIFNIGLCEYNMFIVSSLPSDTEWIYFLKIGEVSRRVRYERLRRYAFYNNVKFETLVYEKEGIEDLNISTPKKTETTIQKKSLPKTRRGDSLKTTRSQVRAIRPSPVRPVCVQDSEGYIDSNYAAAAQLDIRPDARRYNEDRYSHGPKTQRLIESIDEIGKIDYKHDRIPVDYLPRSQHMADSNRWLMEMNKKEVENKRRIYEEHNDMDRMKQTRINDVDGYYQPTPMYHGRPRLPTYYDNRGIGYRPPDHYGGGTSQNF